MMNFERKKGLAQLANIKVHAFEFQAFCFFLSMMDLPAEIEDRVIVDNDYFKVIVSLPHEMDPQILIEHWKQWHSEELVYDYGPLN